MVNLDNFSEKLKELIILEEKMGKGCKSYCFYDYDKFKIKEMKLVEELSLVLNCNKEVKCLEDFVDSFGGEFKILIEEFALSVKNMYKCRENSSKNRECFRKVAMILQERIVECVNDFIVDNREKI